MENSGCTMGEILSGCTKHQLVQVTRLHGREFKSDSCQKPLAMLTLPHGSLNKLMERNGRGHAHPLMFGTA